MSDKERLNAWMKERNLDCRAVAEATGETYQSVYWFTRGSREPNPAFKWRFTRAFGLSEAQRVFDDAPRSEAVPA